MSRENIEIVRRFLEEFDAALEAFWAEPDPGDASAALRDAPFFEMMHPGAEWISLFYPESFRGKDEMLRGVSEWLDAADQWRVRTNQLLDAGDRVLGVVRVSIRGKGSGVPVEQTLYAVVTVRDGMVAAIHEFGERAEALEAAGLSE